MKLLHTTTIPRILMALILGSAILTGQAQDLKLGTMDFKSVFDGYWKKKQAEKNLQERQQSYQEAREGLLKDYQTATEDYRKLIESANDQAVSGEERDRRQRQAEVKLQDVQDIENSIKQFDSQMQANLTQQRQRSMNSIIREIQDVVISKAKAEKYSMILDVSGMTPNLVPVVLYHDGTRDISGVILNTLNLSAPAQYKETE